MTVKIPGYSYQQIDITTVGLSGVISLDLESKDEVHMDKLP